MSYCQSTTFFPNFHSKFEMPIYMKVVSLNKMDNFHKGRFWSVLVKFGERGKSSGRHSLTSMFKRGSTVSLTKGWLRVRTNLVKGFIRVHWRGFRGDDPGWPRFDQCSAGLTRLIRSLALMMLIKNLGRHNTPSSWGPTKWIRRGKASSNILCFGHLPQTSLPVQEYFYHKI
jgi:hypothetical protein